MRRALALLLGLILTLTADGVTAAQLGYARASCLSGAITPMEAISSCTAVLQKFHKHTAVLIRRGSAFAELGSFDYAVGDFSRAITLDPADALAVELRGLAYELQGKLAESLQDYRLAQALGPPDPMVAAAISRVTLAMTPAPASSAPVVAEMPVESRAALLALTAGPETPARAADGWLVAISLIFAGGALALRPGRRREGLSRRERCGPELIPSRDRLSASCHRPEEDMRFSLAAATTAMLAALVSAACAEDAKAPAPAGSGAGTTAPGARPSTPPPPASGGQPGKAGSDESGKFGSGVDWGVGSGAGSTGMRGGAR